MARNTTDTPLPHEAGNCDVQHEATPTQLAIKAPTSELDTLNIDELARLLHRSRATILTDRCRHPERVPPACTPPGARYPLWIREDVFSWLREHPDPRHPHPHSGGHLPPRRRRPGRPTKAESIQQSRGGA